MGLIGKGSIGAVEKVVHRHHSVITHGIVEEDDDENGEGGGVCDIFNNCCGSIAGNRGEREKKGPCWGGFFAKLFNNQRNIKVDAFEVISGDY